MAYNLPMQLNLQAPTPTNISSVKTAIEKGLGNIAIGIKKPGRDNIAEIREYLNASTLGKVKLQLKNPTKPELKAIRDSIQNSLSGIKIQGLGLDPKSIKAIGIANAKIIEAEGKAAAKLAEVKKPKSRAENEAIRRESTARARATTSGQKAKNKVTEKIGAAKARVTPEMEIAKNEAEIQNKKKLTNARILLDKKKNAEDQLRKNQNQADIERIRQKNSDDEKLRKDQRDVDDNNRKNKANKSKLANEKKIAQARENAINAKQQSEAANAAKIAQAKANAITLNAQTKASKAAQKKGGGGGGGQGGKTEGVVGVLEGKAKSFAAYAAVSTAFFKLGNAINIATQDAINFEKELINIAQTTGDSVGTTKKYSDQLVKISREYNISLTKAAQLTRILTQTGMSFGEAARGAEILARTSLLSGFDSLTDTTEGFIAVMSTFDLSVTRAGQVLESINKLSKDYAVESGDLVEAIKRTGGAFKAAGGSVEELLSLITSVRSTTRESAETISTGFRTIFARLERPKTIEYFKKLGIVLENADGQFIGPYQAIQLINKGLQELNITVGTTKFAEVVEEIGGIRQISKVIPLLNQAKKQTEALNKAFDAGSESIQDIQKAQQGLGYRLGALQKDFAALVSEVVNSSSFKFLADVFINLSKAILGVVGNLKPLLPLLSIVGTAVAGRMAGQFLQGPVGANKRERDAAKTGLSKSRRDARRADRQNEIKRGRITAAGGGGGGMGGGGTSPSVSPSFFGGSRKNQNGPEDLFRGTGKIIDSMEDLDFEFTNLIRHLGDAGKELKKQFQVGEYTGPHGYYGVARTDKEGKNYIEINFGKGGATTLGHEVGHGIDQMLAKGSKKRFASQIEGTLQETIVKALKSKVAKHLQEQEGVRPGSHKVNIEGKQVDYFEYRMRNEEIFADAFANLDPLIQGIVSNTTDAKKGMQQIAELFLKYPDRFRTMYANIDEDLHIVHAAKQQMANTALKEAKEDSARLARSSGGYGEEVRTKVGLLKDSGLPINSRSAKRALQTEGQKQLGSQIKEVVDKIKELQQAEKDYDDQIDKLKQNYEEIAGKKPATRSEAKIQAKKKRDLQNQVRQATLNARKTRESILEKQQERETLSKEYQTNRQDINKTARGSFKVSKSGVKDGFGYLESVEKTKKFNDSLDNFKNKINETTKSITNSLGKLNITFIEFATYTQSAASFLKEFAGMNINQEALTAATAKGGMYSLAEDSIKMASTRKNVFLAGKALEKMPGPLGKFGSTLLKNAGTISSAGKVLGNVLKGAWLVELAGGFFDAIATKDYSKQTKNFIEMGDAASAAAAAAKSYAAEQYRSIPILGGFISGLRGVTGMDQTKEENLGATGRLVVSTAELGATVVAASKEAAKQQQEFKTQVTLGDTALQQKAFSQQLDAVDTIITGIDKNSQRIAGLEGGLDLSKIGEEMLSKGTFGAAAGAGIGGIPTAGVGAIPGAGVGFVAGSVIGGAAELGRQLFTSRKEITDAYMQQTEAIKEVQSIMLNGIEAFGSSLQDEAVRVVRGGGTLEDAVKNVTDKIGKDNINRLLKGRKIGTDPKEEIKALGSESNEMDKRIKLLKTEKNGLKDSDTVGREKLNTQIAVIESEKAQIDALRNVLVATQAAAENERKLAQERKVQSAAIVREIKLRQSFQKGLDAVNQSFRDLSNISQEIDNIGTGKLTSRQAAAKVGVPVQAKVLEMSTEEILRTAGSLTGPLAQMANSVDKFAAAQGMGTGPGQTIRDVSKNFELLGKLTDPAMLERNLTGARKEDATAATDLKNKLLKEINVPEGANALLEAAVLDYAKAILEGGPEAAAEAEQAAREKVSKQAAELIEQNKEQLNRLAQAEQEYREMQIALVERKMKLAQDVYDNEKRYFNERLELNNKVRDALTVEPTGPSRAGFVAGRAGADRAAQMAGLNARRAQGFADVGLQGNNPNAIQQVLEDVKILGADFQTLTGITNMLISTIRDEIEIEGQYLDGLIESAKAQQEYTQALNDAQGAIVRDLVTGTDEEVKNQLQTMSAAGMAAQQGSFVGIPESMKKDIFSLFDQFRGIEIPGLGKKGEVVQRDIIKNEMMKRFGVDAATAEQLASKAVGDRVPVDQRMAEQIKTQEEKIRMLFDQEKSARQIQLDIEKQNNVEFGNKVLEFGQHVDKLKEDLGIKLSQAIAEAMNKTADVKVAEQDAAAKAAAAEKEKANLPPKPIDLTSLPRFGINPRNRAMSEDLEVLNQKLKNSKDATESQQLELKIAEMNKKLYAGGGSKQDIDLYREAYRNALQQIERNKNPANAPPIEIPKPPMQNNAVGAIPIGRNQEAPTQTVQVESNGQQQITISLPDIQALVNKDITSMVLQTVAGTFNNMAENARTAQNFEDLATAIANASTQTTNQKIGGTA